MHCLLVGYELMFMCHLMMYCKQKCHLYKSIRFCKKSYSNAQSANNIRIKNDDQKYFNISTHIAIPTHEITRGFHFFIEDFPLIAAHAILLFA